MMYASGWILTCFASDLLPVFLASHGRDVAVQAWTSAVADFITNVAVSILNEATEELAMAGMRTTKKS